MIQALDVQLMVDFAPGKPLRWAALTQAPPHPAGQGSTPVGYGASVVEALSNLHEELQHRSDQIAAQLEPERVVPPIQAKPGCGLERIHTHFGARYDTESDRVFCACGAWQLADGGEPWKELDQ
jgi:hypothetical protein